MKKQTLSAPLDKNNTKIQIEMIEDPIKKMSANPKDKSAKTNKSVTKLSYFEEESSASQDAN